MQKQWLKICHILSLPLLNSSFTIILSHDLHSGYRNTWGAVKKFRNGGIAFQWLDIRQCLPNHLHSRTLAHRNTFPPTIVPLLEASAEGLCWNLPEFGGRIRFNVLRGCETCLLEEQPKVTQSEIRRVQCFGDDRKGFLGKVLLHYTRCVARRVIVIQKPLSLPATCRAAAPAKLALRNDQ
jgi:hypothetical protein